VLGRAPLVSVAVVRDHGLTVDIDQHASMVSRLTDPNVIARSIDSVNAPYSAKRPGRTSSHRCRSASRGFNGVNRRSAPLA
jgi:hypothetical protein